MTGRVPPDQLIEALAGDDFEALAPDDGGISRSCIIAQDLYFREARSMTVWTVLTWALGAATVAFLLLILWLLATALLEPGDAFARAAKVAGAAGTAVATWITGKAAGFVFERRKDQSAAVGEILQKVHTICGDQVAQRVEQEAARSAYRPLR